MYEVTVDCHGIAPDLGPIAAADIEREFREHRRRHLNATCRYEEGMLTLTATNDFDATGATLLDEFGDCVVAYVGAHGAMHIRRVEQD